MRFLPLLALFFVTLSAADFSMDASGKGGTTSILSETLEMVSTDTENTFYFTKNVRASGTNLQMTANQVVVTSTRDGSKQISGIGSIGVIKKIVASGNVVIEQDGRRATAGRAEFFPKEGRVVLTENPMVVDSKAIVSGWRITLVQGERRVKVEQDPNGQTRPTVSLSELPDLGYDPKKQPAEAPELKPINTAPVSQ